MHPFASSMSANRFDEGYSEDTRSQSGSDLVLRSDSRLMEDGIQPDSPFSLPDWVTALSEGERSGESTKLRYRRLAHVY
jgi:F-box and WD-40 domain protein 1/11